MVTSSIPANGPSPPAAGARTGRLHALRGWLEDAILLLVGVLLFPLIILLIGTPVALLVRALVELVRR